MCTEACVQRGTLTVRIVEFLSADTARGLLERETAVAAREVQPCESLWGRDLTLTEVGMSLWGAFFILDGLTSEDAMNEMLDVLNCSCQCRNRYPAPVGPQREASSMTSTFLKPGRGHLARESSARGSAKIEALL